MKAPRMAHTTAPLVYDRGPQDNCTGANLEFLGLFEKKLKNIQ